MVLRSGANGNIEKKKQLRGFNSFVASRPFQEFQVDLFFMGNVKFSVAMLIVDIFTKYALAILLKSKAEGDILSGLIAGFHKMGGGSRVCIFR